MAPKSKTKSLNVETLTHDEATRKNFPTADNQPMMRKDVEPRGGDLPLMPCLLPWIAFRAGRATDAAGIAPKATRDSVAGLVVQV